MEMLITILVFIGWVGVFSLSVVCVLLGYKLAQTEQRRGNGKGAEATTQVTKSGFRFTVKAAGGVLLALAGLGGCVFCVYEYWQTLTGILLVPLMFGGVTQMEKVGKKEKEKSDGDSALGK